jgi:hypothetical protein
MYSENARAINMYIYMYVSTYILIYQACIVFTCTYTYILIKMYSENARACGSKTTR